MALPDAESIPGAYLAYFQLHDIPWKLKDEVRLRGEPSGIEVELRRGPYKVPRLAMQNTTTRAGSAQFDLSNDVVELKDANFLGIHIPTKVYKQRDMRLWVREWRELARQAEDLSAAVGLCLRQRRPVRKVAEYVIPVKHQPGYAYAYFNQRGWPGHKAAISKRSIESVRRTLGRVMDSDVKPNLLVALRWLERSKDATEGADRLLDLWIALEALVGPIPKHLGNAEVIQRAARELAHKHYGLGLSADDLTAALGLSRMVDWRNHILHRGERPEPWPLSPNPEDRDFPQMLDDIVTEVLRHKLGAGRTTAVREHVRRWKGVRT